MTSVKNVRRRQSASASLWQWLLLAALLLICDQLTKLAVLRTFAPYESRPITSFFNLVLVFNEGAAFSFLSQAGGWQRWFFIALGSAAAVVITYLLHRHRQQTLFCAALSLILGGAIGNVLDRVIHKHVIDFLDFYWKSAHWPAFNVADIGISLGAGLLILDEFLRVQRKR